MESGQDQEDKNQLVQSFLFVRQAIGIIGFSLPIALLLSTLFGVKMQTSISGFYYTQMGDVLVGALCAIGIFLLSYKGYQPQQGERITDKIAARIAGISAIGVALFPVGAAAELTTGFTFHNPLIHYICAGIFFVSLAGFCIFLFTKGDRTAAGKIIWTTRNTNYVACGCVILLAITALTIYFVQPAKQFARDQYNYLFWWETLGVLAFAISWLAKGQTLANIGNMWGRLTQKISR